MKRSKYRHLSFVRVLGEQMGSTIEETGFCRALSVLHSLADIQPPELLGHFLDSIRVKPSLVFDVFEYVLYIQKERSRGIGNAICRLKAKEESVGVGAQRDYIPD